MRLLGRDVGGAAPLFFMAGPCVIESRELAMRTGEIVAGIAARTGALIIYKSSFDKANRTSLSSYRGPGLDEGLKILQEVRAAFELPIVTDIHEADQISAVAEVADVLQTPAFLARQTDFIMAAASAGKAVNIKKAQFLSAGEMAKVAEKALSTGNDQIMLCERGSMFGYGNLVVDMRGLEIMAETGQPIVFDATHSVQLPGGLGGSSGGERRFVPALARAAVAVGVAGVFMESHPNPDAAMCDGPNAWPMDQLEPLIRELQGIDRLRKGGACATGGGTT